MQGEEILVFLSRAAEVKIIDKGNKQRILSTSHLPYGSILSIKDKTNIKKGDKICEWDPYNAVIISEFGGTIEFED